MKKVVRLTESDLIGLIKKIIKENDERKEHLKYTHPITGDECELKIAKRKSDERYTAILICDVYHDGDPMVIASLPIFKRTPEEVSKVVCDNIERSYEILDSIVSSVKDVPMLNESISSRYEVFDEPITCSSDSYREPKSWEM